MDQDCNCYDELHAGRARFILACNLTASSRTVIFVPDLMNSMCDSDIN